jgi:hypothetical protein
MPKSKKILKTSDKPAKKPGRGGNILPDAPKPFSKKYQPTPEAKKAGWAKKKRGYELVRAVLELSFKGMKGSEIKQKASEYFGVPQKNLTVEMLLHFRQAEKAIQKADTQAYNAVMDRAFGKPKEKLEHSGADGKPIEMRVNKVTHTLLVKKCDK